LPLVHSSWALQLVAQALPRQLKRPQLRVVPPLQAPRPSQVAAAVSVPPLQLRCPQLLPALAS
jgi:hypothetical protein